MEVQLAIHSHGSYGNDWSFEEKLISGEHEATKTEVISPGNVKC